MSTKRQPDLVFEPNDVGPNCAVECWISQSPRATDPSFDPQPVFEWA
jgi:hypothetical protein